MIIFISMLVLTGSCSERKDSKASRSLIDLCDTIIKKDSTLSIIEGQTYIFFNEGILYLKKSKSGIIKGYYEYGSINEDQFCNTYIEIKNQNEDGWFSLYYGTFSDLNKYGEFEDTTYLSSGLMNFKDSMMHLKKGGGMCSRFVNFNDVLELPLTETTSDKFIIILQDKPKIYSENLSIIQNEKLYTGMILRSLSTVDEYFKVDINGGKYLIKQEDCKLWD